MNEGSIWVTILWVVSAITAVLIMLEALRRVVIAPLVRGVKALMAFLSDWNGSPATPGHPAEPSVMAQMQELRSKMNRVEYHTGNGQEPSLRAIVEKHTRQLGRLTDAQGLDADTESLPRDAD